MRLRSGSHSVQESSLSHPHPPTYATSQVRLVPSYMGGGCYPPLAYMRIHPQLHFHRKTILWPGAIATAPDIALDVPENSNVDFIYKRIYLSFGLLQTSLLIFPLSHNFWATKPMSLSLHSLFSYPLGWHFKTGTFGVFTCQKMALRAPRSKNGVQKPRETPPKMVG